MKKYMGIIRFAAGAAVFAAGSIISPDNDTVSLIIFLIAYVISGIDVLISAVKNLFKGHMLDENFLMSIASAGAFIVGEYPEGVAVMLFYQLGELFQSYAVGRSRRSIAELMDIRPDYANVKGDDGQIIVKDPYDVEIGDVIVIKAGERVPLDAVVIDGSSSLDTSALTGESIPRDVSEGDVILSGFINQSGLITAEVLKEFGESTASKILDLVENASSKKSKSENFITKFARYYTPAVVGIAVLLGLIPPLLIRDAQFSDWIYRALTFLVISCPCALVISVPMSFFGGIGGASKLGILVKGSNYLEALSYTDTVVFDKTGTLTKGVFKVQAIKSENGFTSEDVLYYGAYAESFSTHPISQSLRQAFGGEIDKSRISDVRETAGHGVSAVIDGKLVLAGNMRLMEAEGIAPGEHESLGTDVHIAVDGRYAGCITISDELKSDAGSAVARLKAQGVNTVTMLTGDSRRVGEAVARELSLDQVYTELLPQDKVSKVDEMLETRSGKGTLAYVGDGINDAPVLARADIGIAMGGLGSDAAIEAADVVIMTDEPSKLSSAIGVSKKTLRIVKQNIIFALLVKALVLVLGAVGIANMWGAVFADVGVSVIAIINALRALNTKGL